MIRGNLESSHNFKIISELNVILAIQCREYCFSFNKGSLGYPKGMGFLRCVGNSTNSYVVVFFLAVEKVFPPEKKTGLAGAGHRNNSPYLFLCRSNFPREGGRG